MKLKLTAMDDDDDDGIEYVGTKHKHDDEIEYVGTNKKVFVVPGDSPTNSYVDQIHKITRS